MDKNTREHQDEKNIPDNKQESSFGVAKNPDPRANENVKDKEEKTSGQNDVGSEITDGEAG